jgi:pimeloyl-ACP methyl ester carboxylesterase
LPLFTVARDNIFDYPFHEQGSLEQAMLTRPLVLLVTLLAVLNSAAAQQAPQRPLVFVPGILGSRLCDPNDTIVWGTVTSFSNFPRLEVGNPENPVLHPCGLVDEIQILGPFWIHDTYKSWLDALKQVGFSPERNNLLVFAYDWRLSNFDNAQRLDALVAAHIPAGKQFDIIAHSMGGIVTRIYLDRYQSARAVNQVIYLGTPFLGSMDTLGTIKEGWGFPLTNLAGGRELVARVAMSFPSMLEMLPRYTDCCYVRKLDGSRQSLDIFDPQTWKLLGWLPSTYSDPARFARFSNELRHSASLTPLLSSPAPSGVYEMIFASDIYDTLRLVGMKEGKTTPRDWVFTTSKGDGTVPVWSVARSTNSSEYSSTLPSFAKHEHLFDDKWVTSVVFRRLLSDHPNEPFQIGAPGRPLITNQNTGAGWPVDIAKVSLNKDMLKPNETIAAELTIQLESPASDLQPGLYQPSAFLAKNGRRLPLTVHEITTDTDLRLKQLRYSASGNVGNEVGPGEIVFPITDSFQPSQGFYVYSGAAQ